jgi:hypothetical protein
MMRTRTIFPLFLLLSLLSLTLSFLVPHQLRPTNAVIQYHPPHSTNISKTKLKASSNKDVIPEPKKTNDLDGDLRTKLISESIAPWRTVRLFFYFSLGSGALIGGLITLAGTIAAMASSRPDVDLNTEVSVKDPFYIHAFVITCQ